MTATSKWNAGDWVPRYESGLSGAEMQAEVTCGRAEHREVDDGGYVLRGLLFRRVLDGRPKWQPGPVDTYLTCRSCAVQWRGVASKIPDGWKEVQAGRLPALRSGVCPECAKPVVQIGPKIVGPKDLS